MKLEEFLSQRHIPFERLPHPPAYTADRVAQVLHVPGKEMAKSVLLHVGDHYVLAILPASRRLNMDRLRKHFEGQLVQLASEEEMDKLFPDCERGSMPPFGSFYNLNTIVDESLAEDEEIVFEAQSHSEALRMRYSDFEALEHPQKGRFAYPM